MNIVVAFTLEAFLLEYESQKTALETKVERRIRELGLETKKEISGTVFDKDNEYVEAGVQFKLGTFFGFSPIIWLLTTFLVRGMTGIDDLLERMFIGESQTQSEPVKE